MQDTQVTQSETPEQIAERIAREHIGTASYYDAARKLLKDAVLSALRNERENCAKVAEDHYEHAVECDGGQACSLNIAAAIREGR